MADLVSHPDEVKVVSRRFGKGASNLERYLELDGYKAVQKALSSRGIATAVYYPVPLHLQPAYASLGHKPGDLPHSECASAQVLSLPVFAEMTDQQIAQVASALRESLGG